MARSHALARLFVLHGGRAQPDRDGGPGGAGQRDDQAGGGQDAAPGGGHDVATDRRADVAVEIGLALALLRGEEAAAYHAFLRFAPLVRASLRRLIGPGLDEEDLCQEVFFRFFQGVKRLRDPAALRAFLYGICWRVGRGELRRRWMQRWLRLSDDGELPDRAAATSGDLDCDAREGLQRYYRILDRVSVAARSLFVTRYLEGVDLEQTARRHGLSVSTTQRRLARVTRRVDAMVRRDPLLRELAERQHREEKRSP